MQKEDTLDFYYKQYTSSIVDKTKHTGLEIEQIMALKYKNELSLNVEKDTENVLLNFRSKSSISGQLKGMDCITAACIIIKQILVWKFCVCCQKCLQSIMHSSTLKAAGIIPNTQFFQRCLSGTQCSISQVNWEHGSKITQTGLPRFIRRQC